MDEIKEEAEQARQLALLATSIQAAYDLSSYALNLERDVKKLQRREFERPLPLHRA